MWGAPFLMEEWVVRTSYPESVKLLTTLECSVGSSVLLVELRKMKITLWDMK
jgi:hypothetical protein